MVHLDAESAYNILYLLSIDPDPPMAMQLERKKQKPDTQYQRPHDTAMQVQDFEPLRECWTAGAAQRGLILREHPINPVRVTHNSP